MRWRPVFHRVTTLWGGPGAHWSLEKEFEDNADEPCDLTESCSAQGAQQRLWKIEPPQPKPLEQIKPKGAKQCEGKGAQHPFHCSVALFDPLELCVAGDPM